MKITIHGTSIPLNNKEVKAAKKIISKFLQNMKKMEEEYMRPSWYLTVLIVMHTLSRELLDSIDPESIQLIFKKFK